MHVSPTFLPFVPVNEMYLVFFEIESKNFFIMFCPFNTARIAEDKERRIAYLASNVFDAPFKIYIHSITDLPASPSELIYKVRTEVISSKSQVINNEYIDNPPF